MCQEQEAWPKGTSQGDSLKECPRFLSSCSLIKLWFIHFIKLFTTERCSKVYGPWPHIVLIASILIIDTRRSKQSSYDNIVIFTDINVGDKFAFFKQVTSSAAEFLNDPQPIVTPLLIPSSKGYKSILFTSMETCTCPAS